jgi:hypothetical protein
MNQTYLNSTKNTVLSLKPSKAIRLLLMVLFFVFFGNVASAANISSKSDGNWSSSSTWFGGIVPSSSDNVTINNTVTIGVNVTVQSVNVIGTLIENSGVVFTVGSAVTSGIFTVGGTFSMGNGNDQSILIVYGNYINNGATDFYKSTVIIAGDLLSPSSSSLQNNGTVIVGGDILGKINLSGSVNSNTIYSIDPYANVAITPPTLDAAIVPGTAVTNSTLVTYVNSIIGSSCSLIVSNPSDVSACLNSSVLFTVNTLVSSPTYQWQVNKNDGLGWNNILNSIGFYSGVTTSTLTVSSVALTMNKYKYRAKINSGTCTQNTNYGTLLINTIPTTWNGTVWNNGSPTASSGQNVIFNGNYDSTSDLTACSCQVNSGFYVNINTGHTLILTNSLSVADTGNILFKDKSSLVQTNDVTNMGAIEYERKISNNILPTDYTYWSSPVVGFKLGGVYPTSTSGLFYSYGVTSGVEDWQPESSAKVMAKGIGYIINGAKPGGPLYIPPTFIGVPNNGDIIVPVEFTGAAEGTSNLLGNPYPSAIDADKFLAANAGVIDGTLYFWTHNTALDLAGNITNPGPGWAYTYSLDDYASYNTTGGVGITGNLVKGVEQIANKPSGKIAAGQGFFATSKAAGNVKFTNVMRIAGGASGNNSQFFKTKNPKGKTADNVEKNRLWLNLTNTEGAFKQTLIGYITDATNDYDNLFDGQSFDANEFVDFYSVYQDKNLVIQGRALPFEETDEVQLGFRTTIDGTFTINIDQVDGVLTNQAVFIEDKLTNTIFDLKSGNYTFRTTPGTFNDRFVLRYNNKTLGAENFDSLANKVLVSNANKQIKINSFAETIDKVVIYDLLGRQVFQKTNVNNNELSIANLISNHQTLVVKTLLQNGNTFTDKIIY